MGVSKRSRENKDGTTVNYYCARRGWNGKEKSRNFYFDDTICSEKKAEIAAEHYDAELREQQKTRKSQKLYILDEHFNKKTGEIKNLYRLFKEKPAPSSSVDKFSVDIAGKNKDKSYSIKKHTLTGAFKQAVDYLCEQKGLDDSIPEIKAAMMAAFPLYLSDREKAALDLSASPPEVVSSETTPSEVVSPSSDSDLRALENHLQKEVKAFQENYDARTIRPNTAPSALDVD